MDEKTKFDDWSDIKDCNQCEPYWNNQCDGAVVGSEKPCKAFVAVRRVSIPAEIKAIRSEIKRLYVSLLLLAITVLIHYIVELM